MIHVRRLPSALLAAATLGVQPAAPRDPPVRWVVAGDVASELWFHSLAILRVNGPGALPFYDQAYADAVAAEKRRRGLPPTRLERDAARLRTAFQSDSAFELLHFLPLYLTRLQPQELTQLLRALPAAQPTKAQPATLTALRAHFASESQRAFLIELADAIDDEWRVFFASDAASRADADLARRASLQSRWDSLYAARLSAWFRAMDIPRGVLLVVPALGSEGRVARLGAAGTIIAVSDWRRAETRDAPLLSAVRELCFPLLSRAAPNAQGADESSRAAVRCGALLADAFIPEVAAEYRSLFLPRRAAETAELHRQRFDAVFHVTPSILRSVSDEIARAKRGDAP